MAGGVNGSESVGKGGMFHTGRRGGKFMRLVYTKK